MEFLPALLSNHLLQLNAFNHATTSQPTASLKVAATAVLMDLTALETSSNLLVARMNKLSVDVSATVLSAKDHSTTPLKLSILHLVLVTLLLRMLVYVAITHLQTNGKYVLAIQLAVEE